MPKGKCEVPEEKTVLCFSAPRGHPRACKGETRCQSARAARAPATSSRAHDGGGGTGAPKPCARATRGQAVMTRGSRNIGRQVPFFLDNTLLQISRSWWMRRQKSRGGGFPVLRRAKDEKRIAPFFPPLPRLRAQDKASTWGRGLDRPKGAQGCSLGGKGRLQEERGRQLASALP